MLKVKAFVDYSNVVRSSSKAGKMFHWPALPHQLPSKVRELLSPMANDAIDFRGINVYASVDPGRGEAGKGEEEYLRYTLDRLLSYSVKIYRRRDVQVTCERGHSEVRRPERGVDTKLACDMLALGIRGSYDVGVLVTDDADLIPAVEAVQEVLDRRIIHLSFKQMGRELRAACWGYLTVEDVFGPGESAHHA